MNPLYILTAGYGAIVGGTAFYAYSSNKQYQKDQMLKASTNVDTTTNQVGMNTLNEKPPSNSGGDIKFKNYPHGFH